MDKEIKTSIEKVKLKLNEHFRVTGGDSLRSIDILNISRRSFSTIVFLKANTNNGDTHKLVMKKVVHAPVNIEITSRENQAVVEFKILEDLYPKFKSVDGCGVPKPILVLPESEAFVMDFVEGHPLSEELGCARYWATIGKFRTLQRHYYLCGFWLRKLHEFTGLQMAGITAFDLLLEQCNLRLKLIKEIGHPRYPNNLLDFTMGFLKEQLAWLKDGEIMIAGRHGDFGHWNILVNNGEIVVIDFLGYAKAPIAYDIIKMLLSFEAWMSDPTARTSRVEAIQREFIDGLGAIIKIPFSVGIICEVYHRIAATYACLSNPGNNWFERYKKEAILKKNLAILSNIIKGRLKENQHVWSHLQN
jgi:hypothetical protein